MRLDRLIFQNPLYPFKHWLTSLAIAPLLLFIFAALKSTINSSADTFAYYILFVAIGFIWSFPTFIVYYFLYIFLVKKRTSPLLIKIILDIEAVLGMFITLKLTGGTAIPDMYAPYFIAIVISSFFYRTEKLTNDTDDKVDTGNLVK